eukprot:28314_1
MRFKFERSVMHMLPLLIVIIIIVYVITYDRPIIGYSQVDRNEFSFDEIWNILQRKIPQSTENIIIVLGKGLNNKGEPSNELLDRIKLSVSTFHSNEQHLSFDNTVFIVSGGDISNHQKHFKFDHKTEAHIMSEILHKQYDIPLNNIYWEYYSKETIENFLNVLKYIRQSNIFEVDRMYIVTSDYHMARCLKIFNTLNRNPFINSNSNQAKYDNYENNWLKIKDRIYTIKLKTNKLVAEYMESKSDNDWATEYLYHAQSYLWTAALYYPEFEFSVV